MVTKKAGTVTGRARQGQRSSSSLSPESHGDTDRGWSGPQRQDADTDQNPTAPRRRSARLQQKRVSAVKPTPSSPRTADGHRRTKQEQEQTGGRTTRAARKAKRRGRFHRLHKAGPGPSSVEQDVRKTANRSRYVEADGGAFDHSSRGSASPEQLEASRPSAVRTKDDFIELWLETSCPSQQTSTRLESSPQTSPEEMSTTLTNVLGSVAFGENPSASSRDSRSAAKHDPLFRKRTLGYRNIHINRETPPQELVERANGIITASRLSPELDDAAIQEVKDLVRELEDKPEDRIKTRLTPWLSLSDDTLPSRKLVQTSGQLWGDAVPIPLRPSMARHPLPLPRPKPDVAFGYSEAAFTDMQLISSNGLFGEETGELAGKSYASPDKELFYPFLVVEFKSQAKDGTHFMATNQAAGAGAIGLNGFLEVFRRGVGADQLDLNEPQFFSLTVDHESVRLNVHWLRLVGEGQYHFHMGALSKYFLDDATQLKKVLRAIKNIFDYSTNVRLPKLCAAIDGCRGGEKQRESMKAMEEAKGAAKGKKRVKERLEPQPQQSPLRTEVGQPLSPCEGKREAETTEDELRAASGQTPVVHKSRKT